MNNYEVVYLLIKNKISNNSYDEDHVLELANMILNDGEYLVALLQISSDIFAIAPNLYKMLSTKIAALNLLVSYLHDDEIH